MLFQGWGLEGGAGLSVSLLSDLLQALTFLTRNEILWCVKTLVLLSLSPSWILSCCGFVLALGGNPFSEPHSQSQSNIWDGQKS